MPRIACSPCVTGSNWATARMAAGQYATGTFTPASVMTSRYPTLRTSQSRLGIRRVSPPRKLPYAYAAIPMTTSTGRHASSRNGGTGTPNSGGSRISVIVAVTTPVAIQFRPRPRKTVIAWVGVVSRSCSVPLNRSPAMSNTTMVASRATMTTALPTSRYCM